MSAKRYYLLVFILGTLTTIGPFSIDMYLPGFPVIAKDLNTTEEKVALSLSSFFIGLSIGQLLYGPLLDKFGRKKPLYIGLAVYIAASVGCMLSSSLESLVAIRFIQAVGSCASGVAAIAMVRDIFPVKDNAKVFALLMLVIGASPMVAPTVGGYVTAAWGWHAIFLILAIIAAVVLLAAIFILPSNYQPDRSLSLMPKPIIRSFWTVLKEPQFYTYTFTSAVAFAGLFAYVAGSPQVFMKLYQVSEQNYGWIFAGLSVGFIGSSQLNTYLLRTYKSEQVTAVAVVLQLCIAALFIIGSYLDILGLSGTIAMLFGILCCIGLINPNASALSLAPFTKNAGSASSLMGAVQLGLGTISSLLVSLFPTKSTLPLAAIMVGSAALAFLIHFFGKRTIKDIVGFTGEQEIVIH